MRKHFFMPLTIAFASVCVALPASASTVTVFNLDVISGAAIGTGIQGTVILAANASDPTHQIDVVVSLASGVLMINTGGPHTPFAFNLDPSVAAATVTVTSVNSPFAFSAASGVQQATPYGDFTNGIAYGGGNGSSHGSAGPLKFSVFYAGGIAISDFVTNLGGYYFAADLRGTGGSTGTVGATGFHEVCISDCGPVSGGGTVPIPAALWMFGSALVGVAGIGKWRRRRTIPVIA